LGCIHSGGGGGKIEAAVMGLALGFFLLWGLIYGAIFVINIRCTCHLYQHETADEGDGEYD
jgi:hypothetical protein